MARNLTMAYRAYLAELDQEGRQSLTVLAGGMIFFALVHPLLLILTLPSTALSWITLYRASKRQFAGLLYKNEVLRRALRFDDYDPDLAESIEPGVHEGTLRFRHSKLENFWRSYEASSRMLGQQALHGYSHILWMVLPLIVLTLGLMFAGPLRDRLNWLPVGNFVQPEYWMAVLQVVAWLLGITAATLGKYIIQVALVNAAWTAVTSLPPEAEATGDDAAALKRDEIITWKLPGDRAPAQPEA